MAHVVASTPRRGRVAAAEPSRRRLAAPRSRPRLGRRDRTEASVRKKETLTPRGGIRGGRDGRGRRPSGSVTARAADDGGGGRRGRRTTGAARALGRLRGPSVVVAPAPRLAPEIQSGDRIRRRPRSRYQGWVRRRRAAISDIFRRAGGAHRRAAVVAELVRLFLRLIAINTYAGHCVRVGIRCARLRRTTRRITERVDRVGAKIRRPARRAPRRERRRAAQAESGDEGERVHHARRPGRGLFDQGGVSRRCCRRWTF